jgi:hypothetical protein
MFHVEHPFDGVEIMPVWTSVELFHVEHSPAFATDRHEYVPRGTKAYDRTRSCGSRLLP